MLMVDDDLGMHDTHILHLASQGGNPFASLFDNELSALKDPAREAAVTKSGERA
jgi:hypothetical protein